MLRGIFLLLIFLILVVATFGVPYAGILGWTWLSLMTPNMLTSGFAQKLPLNFILAIVTIASWFISREPKRLPINAITLTWIAFALLITITTHFALNSDLARERWDKTIKVMMLGVLVAIMTTNRQRAHALVWTIVLSLGYFGIKGGLFTILTGAGGHVIGVAGSSIYDNNYLALALSMTLPLMYFLYLQSSSHLTRVGLVVAMLLTAVAVLGTYSRGGIVGLTIMALFLWLRSKRRFLIAALGLTVLLVVSQVMPARWIERVDTLEDPTQQSTLLMRLDSWKVAYQIALSRPFIGGGFGATEDAKVYRAYSYGQSYYSTLPGYRASLVSKLAQKNQIAPAQANTDVPPDYTGGHAVHSIYLQVLGDHGFLGLFLFLFLMIGSWWRMNRLWRRAGMTAGQQWISDLASMMQVAMVAYGAAGAAVSMSYYDLPYLLVGLTLALAKIQAVQTSALGEGNVLPAMQAEIGLSGVWQNASIPIQRDASDNV